MTFLYMTEAPSHIQKGPGNFRLPGPYLRPISFVYYTTHLLAGRIGFAGNRCHLWLDRKHPRIIGDAIT